MITKVPLIYLGSILNIQRVFASVGIKFTPPSKDETDYEFMDIWEVDFLKRTYRYDKDLNAIVAPLSLESLQKMQTMWVASDSISPESQALNVIAAAIREYFLHGREKFEHMRAVYIDLMKYKGWHHGINTTILPTYEMMVERYNDASSKILGRLPDHSFQIQSGYVYEPTTAEIITISIFTVVLNLFFSVTTVYFLHYTVKILRIFKYRLPSYNMYVIIASANSNIIMRTARNFYYTCNSFFHQCLDRILLILWYIVRYILLPLTILYANYQYFKLAFKMKTQVRPLRARAFN
jgi:hypothetical protein